MLWDVPQAATYSLLTPSRPLRRRDGADQSALNSGATRWEAGRVVPRQCRAATLRRVEDRGCRASLLAGVREGLAGRAAARQGRSRVEMTPRLEFGRGDCGRDGHRARTACQVPARARRGSRATNPALHVFGSEAPSRLVQPCEQRDHPKPTVDRVDRLSFAPKAPAARSSARLGRATAARRSAAYRSPTCRDRPRKVRPQGDHLRASGCCGRSIIRRAERRTAVWASAELRRAITPADTQIARKSGLRRTHSHANPRVFNVSSAR